MDFVYVLECADRSLYVGSTRNLEWRLEQHRLGQGATYTRERLPVRLVWSEEFEHIGDAFAREQQIRTRVLDHRRGGGGYWVTR